MVLVVLTEPDALAAVRSLLRRLYLVHIPLSIIAIKYVRNIGVVYAWNGLEEMWVGLAIHKNNLGQVAMCSGLVASWQVLQNWTKRKLTLDLLLLLLTLWVLTGSKNSHSSTAIVGFFVGVAVLLVLQPIRSHPRQAKRILLLGVVAICLLAPVVLGIMAALDTSPLRIVTEATGRDMTLTGRTGLWRDVIANASHSPLVGVGLGAFWVGDLGFTKYPLPNWSRVTPEWRPGQAHNGYVDVYVDLGAIGLVLVIIVIVRGFAGATADLQRNFELGAFRLVLLASIVLNNFTESSLLKGTHSLWFLFLLVAVNVPIRTRREGPGARNARLAQG